VPVVLKAGAIVRQTITTQWARLEEQLLANLDVNVILAYASNTNLTQAQRNAFNRIAEMKRTIESLLDQVQAESNARDRVYQEQGRIRENIKAVPPGSDIQARYLKSMNELEDQAETHKRNIDRLEQQLVAERQKLADYVAGLQL
jgi:septal ring factor EnvC (AmiA/AmiB activator)